MSKEVVYIPVYIDKWKALTDALTEQDRNKLIGAYLDYAVFHSEPTGLTKTSKVLFQFMKTTADDLWKDKGGAPEGNQNAKKKTTEKQPVETTEKQLVDLSEAQLVETEKNNSYTKAKAKANTKAEREAETERRLFAAPTLDDVKKFAEESGLDVNPDRFFKYYQARGWKVKGDPISDWQALMESWTTPDGKPKAKQPSVKPVKSMVRCPDCESLKTETRLDHAICRNCGKGFDWDFTDGRWVEEQ